MDKISCLEEFEGANVKYHSVAVFSSSSSKIRQKKYPNKTNVVLNLKKVFLARNMTFWQIEGGEIKRNNSFFEF